MKILKDTKLRTAIIIFITIYLMFELIAFFSFSFFKQTNENELYKQSYAIETEIQKILLNVSTITEAYTSFMESNPNSTITESEDFLYHLLKYEEVYVRNIAYIEDTTIKFNYPYEDNSSSIGIDLATVPDQSDDILYVKENKEPLFIGPVELVQGGTAFIIRSPQIIDDVYYGQIATVIDADELISTLTDKAETYNVSLKIIDQNGNQMIAIGDDFDKNYVSLKIENVYLNWDLLVIENRSSLPAILINVVIRIVGLLSGLAVCVLYYKNKTLNEEVYFKANHDSLTKDFNRTKFIEDFSSHKFVGKLIGFADINKFKAINDTLGHHFGDWALIMMSKRFNSSGKFDIYRISGDEFVIVSKESMKEQTFIEYVKQFNSPIFNEQLNQEVSLTLSTGVIVELESSLTLEKMLMYLDYAMYDAKRMSKEYTSVNHELMEKYSDQKEIEDTIADDINNNRLHIYYQPIISLKDKKIEGVEVLSRWIRNGVVTPASSFIEVVKRIKYVDKLDVNLFNNLQLEYKNHKEEFEKRNINFSINLSAETLKMFENNYLRFDKFIENIIIPKKRINFEISEDINLGLISINTLNYIKENDFDLSIDDFGSGVSKLTEVLSGAITWIKIDRQMVPESLKDKKQCKAFATIIKAINASGSNVCVEGVETKEQLKIVIDSGAVSAQGYLFAKPLPYSELIEFIDNFDFNNYYN